MYFKSCLVVCLVLFFFGVVPAQNSWTPVAGINAGRLINNHKDFPEIERIAYGVNLGVFQNQTGKKWWHQYYRFPQLGAQIQFVSPGNNEVLGQIITGKVTMRFELGQTRSHPWMLNTSVGLGYLTKPFDVVSNNENIILGTRWNNATQIGIEKGLRQFDNQQLFVSLSILHLSNAGTHPDNVGINIPMLSLNMYPTFDKSDITPQTKSIRYIKPIQLGIRASYGFQQFQAEHGPTFGVSALNIYGTKHLSPINKVSVGIEGVYSEAVHVYILNQEIVTDQERKNASRLVTYLAHELMFGHVALYSSLGFYVYHPVLRQKDFSSKLGVQYYFNDVLTSENQIAIGAFVQSYLGSADYLEFGLSYQF